MEKKILTLELKPEEVDEVIHKVQNMTEDAELYIRLTRNRITELLGNELNEDDFKKFLEKIIDFDWDKIIENPRTQTPIIKPFTEE